MDILQTAVAVTEIGLMGVVFAAVVAGLVFAGVLILGRRPRTEPER